LEHCKAKAAPIKLFKDPFPYSKNGFKVGMKMEGIDPEHPSYYCVLTVADVQGKFCKSISNLKTHNNRKKTVQVF
jgi:hypothetical protein